MKKVIILGQGTTGKKLAERCAIQNVSVSVCSHIMCRNPKEHQENKCRLCGLPYKKQNER